MQVGQEIPRIIKGRVAIFRRESELWKSDHEEAMRYFDFCDHLNTGIHLYNEICRLDENWRESVHSQKCPYDSSQHRRIMALFLTLARVAFDVEGQLLPKYESQFGVQDGAEFRKVCRELRGIVSEDASFFDSEALAALRDEALEAVDGETDIDEWTSKCPNQELQKPI